MLRQASSRNQRSKGFKVKHIIQICLLVAICVWLLYQVKHSHEKKRAFEERNAQISNKLVEDQTDIFRFGRKDLPNIEKTGLAVNTHNNEEESEETQEEEEEHDRRQEQVEVEVDQGRGDGDDEIDEQDQEGGDEEADNGEESTEDEGKDGHDEEKDGQDAGDEEKDGQDAGDEEKDAVDVFDNREQDDNNQEHEGGETQEAREENYKRDDASSAVVHETHATESESTESAGHTDAEQAVDGVENESRADGSKTEGEVENTENVRNETENVSGNMIASNVSDTGIAHNETEQTDDVLPNSTTADNKDVEAVFSKPDGESVSNSNGQIETQTVETTNNTEGVSNPQPEKQNNSSVVDAAGKSSEAGSVNLDSTQDQHVAAENATLETVNSESTQDQNIAAENSALAEDQQKSEFLLDPTEKSDATTGLDSEDNSAQGESDSSLHAAAVTEEERDARTDLSTLPENHDDIKTTDDEAAE